MTSVRWAALAAALLCPQLALAAELDGGQLSVLWGVPFAGILLSIAVFPLLAPTFWHHHFGKVAAANDTLKAQLQASMDAAVSLANESVKLATDQILNQERLSYAGPAYVELFTRAIDAQFVVNEAAMNSLESLLEKNASALERAEGRAVFLRLVPEVAKRREGQGTGRARLQLHKAGPHLGPVAARVRRGQD